MNFSCQFNLNLILHTKKTEFGLQLFHDKENWICNSQRKLSFVSKYFNPSRNFKNSQAIENKYLHGTYTWGSREAQT